MIQSHMFIYIFTHVLLYFQEKEEVEAELEHKYERWEYLNDLAQKIEEQKNSK